MNLGSLPAAEAWVDGKPAGTTPLAVCLTAGRHEVVLKQVGFSEHREALEVQAGAVGALDAALDPISADDLDAVRQIAASFGVTVDPFQSPEMHRGGSFDGGLSLLFPRNDVRREGLASYRIDVTPAYDGKGWLEFRRGKTVLSRSRFAPETLATTSRMPSEVVEAVRVGETVTWGVWFEDGRKPVTAQFEVVNKPAAAKKLAELAADRRLARMPVTVKAQLEAEVLQNYRLYSEALTRLLSNRSLDKDGTLSYQGIVSCLRRLDLEDTSLFAESSLLVKGKGPGLRSGGELASGSIPRLGTAPGRVTAPLAARSTPLRPGDAPASGGAAGGTPPPADDGGAGGMPPAPIDPASRDPLRPIPGEPAAREVSELTQRAEQQTAAADLAAQAAATARARANDAMGARDAARTALEAAPEDPAARQALADAERVAADTQRQADHADDVARTAASDAKRTTDAARLAALRASKPADAASGTPGPSAPVARPGTIPPVAPPAAPTSSTPSSPIVAARATFETRRGECDAARTALAAAESAASATPDDTALQAAADEARQAVRVADERASAAAAVLAALERSSAAR